MARVAVTKTSLPMGFDDGAEGLLAVTTGDATNDHVINNVIPGDIIGTLSTSATASTTNLQAYANRYGRPQTVPSAELSDAGESASGRLVFYYVTDLDGHLNATGGVELDVTQAHRVFAIRTGGKF